MKRRILTVGIFQLVNKVLNMSKLKLYIMCGTAFSGKSTLAKKISEYTGSKLISFDKLWAEKEKLGPIPEGDDGWRYIRNEAQKAILASLKLGTSVVYDDTNVRKEHREELMRLARKAGAETLIIYLDTPSHVINSREEANKISKERHEVWSADFQEAIQQLEIPTEDENVFVFMPEMDIEDLLKKL